MKLILKTYRFRFKLDNNLANPLYNSTIKQLNPHDPNYTIWYALRTPIYIKLNDQIYTPIRTQLENIPI